MKVRILLAVLTGLTILPHAMWAKRLPQQDPSGIQEMGWKASERESIETVQGPFRIDQIGDGYRLYIAQQFIAELQSYSVRVSTTLPSPKSAQYVLLEISTGGGSCPYLHRLLDLTPGEKPFLTHEFGNCGEYPAIGMKDDSVVIDFRATDAFRAESFRYNPADQRSKRLKRLPLTPSN